MDLVGIRGEKRHQIGRAKIRELVENLAGSEDETDANIDQADLCGRDVYDTDLQSQTADLESRGMADKMNSVFDLHTTQRMKHQNPDLHSKANKTGSAKSKRVRGVSIPSQRRFVGYWARVLARDDPRPSELLAPPNASHLKRIRRQISVEQIRIYMQGKTPGFPALLGKTRISVHLGKYKSSFIDDLERRDLELREMRRLEKRPQTPEHGGVQETEKLRIMKTAWSSWDDNRWDDRTTLLEKQGGFFERHHVDGHDAETEATDIIMYRTLYPKIPADDGQLLVDADREMQLKLLFGDTGRKHSILPDVVRN